MNKLVLISILSITLTGCKTNRPDAMIDDLGWREDGIVYEYEVKPVKTRRKSKPRIILSRKKRPARLSSQVYAASHATISCLNGQLVTLLNKVASHYKRPVRIQSGYRSKRYNRKVGGARRSQHISCRATDIVVAGVNKYKLARYLKRLPGRGGVGTYCDSSSVHLDTANKRSWHYGCRKRKNRSGRALTIGQKN